MTKPDLMAELAAYELVMVSGVSPQNNVSYGFFRNAAQAGAVGMLLIEADRRDNPEWTDFKVTHHAELEAVVRVAYMSGYVQGCNDQAVVGLNQDELREDAARAADHAGYIQAMHNSAREGMA